jgi:hypothetical protein
MTRYSFLLPTRKRVLACIESIESIRSTATNKDSFEILLAFDDDDDESQSAICAHCEANGVKYKAITSERYGYRNLHKYVNLLCEIADGEMLWLWTDDAKIMTDGWDEKILKYGTDMALDFPNNHSIWIFPLVPAKYVKEMGHFSGQAHNDTWIQVIFEKNLRLCNLVRDVSLYHNRTDGAMNIDYTDVDRDITVSSPEFYSDVYRQMRLDDTNKILAKFFPHRAPLASSHE